jgi:transcriptional regulator with XRE-family HTH domain
MEDVYYQVGTILKDLRDQKQKPIVDVARSIGIAEASLSRYENGKVRIPLAILCKALAYYNYPLLLEPLSRKKSEGIGSIHFSY